MGHHRLRSAVFTTERLGASKLDGVAWTVYYVRSFTYDAARNRASISLHFDGSGNSRIVNFTLSSAGVEGELRIMGDGLTWLVVSY